MGLEGHIYVTTSVPVPPNESFYQYPVQQESLEARPKAKLGLFVPSHLSTFLVQEFALRLLLRKLHKSNKVIRRQRHPQSLVTPAVLTNHLCLISLLRSSPQEDE